MEKVINLFRIIISIFMMPFSAWWGSVRLNRMFKKNIKEQDQNIHSYDDRWNYLRKKAKKMAKFFGIKINVIGIENIPKGGVWIVPNHTSNLDAIYLVVALGGKIKMTPIGRDTFKKDRGFKKIIGNATYRYIRSVDGMFINRSSPRQAFELMNAAAQYAKNNGRGIVVFPEGTRSYTTELLDFKNGSFKFPQKYFLPILPITITGSLQAKRFFSLKTKEVNVKIHPVIKAINHSKKPTEVISNKIKNLIQSDLDNYISSLNDKQLKEFNNLKEKAIYKMKKKNKIIDKELEK